MRVLTLAASGLLLASLLALVPHASADCTSVVEPQPLELQVDDVLYVQGTPGVAVCADGGELWLEVETCVIRVGPEEDPLLEKEAGTTTLPGDLPLPPLE